MEGTKIEDEHRECLLAQFITERKSKLQRDQPNEHPRRHGDPPSSGKLSLAMRKSVTHSRKMPTGPPLRTWTPWP